MRGDTKQGVAKFFLVLMLALTLTIVFGRDIIQMGYVTEDLFSTLHARKEKPTVDTEQNKPVLPLALRETELTESDVAVMLRVARDKTAQAGRYKRAAKRLPVAEPVVNEQK